jgi:hypothetical protein
VRRHALEVGQRVAGEVGGQLRRLVLLLRAVSARLAAFAAIFRAAATVIAVAVAITETVAAMAVAVLETTFLLATLAAFARGIATVTLWLGIVAIVGGWLARLAVLRGIAGIGGWPLAWLGLFIARARRCAFRRRSRLSVRSTLGRALGYRRGRRSSSRRSGVGIYAGFIGSTRLARTFLGKAAGFGFVVGHRVPRECE